MIAVDKLTAAFNARSDSFSPTKRPAIRLFHGFTEGDPRFTVDLYGNSIVLYDHTEPLCSVEELTQLADLIRAQYPWVKAIVCKRRAHADSKQRNGQLIFGTEKDLDHWIDENGVRYSIDLTATLDATFFIDTRLLRKWLFENSKDKFVLNTFAYTGSLGIAAMMGGAKRVIQLDRNKKHLDIAKQSCTLNRQTVNRADYRAEDFFVGVARLKKEFLFDTVILDPPFFSNSNQGKVDLEQEYDKLINKLRPLIAHQGRLICVNNALFVSGQGFMAILDKLCASGYIAVEQLIDIPADCKAMAPGSLPHWPQDPTPFQHPTKIAILQMTREDRQPAGPVHSVKR